MNKQQRDDIRTTVASIRGMRLVCRRRAQKLRKRGHGVRFVGWSPAGQSVYAWSGK